ncbi:c-type cytochrome [Aerolutibacter ruishenii]|uniref:Cytochrome c553 n=1 Tax=Aerolutibacter ruishenii TaxID=686800 RepID=A0A562LHW5_9GAMM|nr:c-type cytochrome [Lysobacter ruishenii]TWI07220.1 cytochrome c553 [Lysobacter ruishenii]
MKPTGTLSTILSLATGSLLVLLAYAQVRAQDAPPPAPQDGVHESAAPHAAGPLLDLRRIQPLRGDAAAGKAKSALCSNCHGEQGISIVPIFPNLAGQRAEYMYWQLVESKLGNLPPSTMTPLVADLSDADMRDLAAYYASLPPNPPLPADRPGDETATPPAADVLARGQALYLEGSPEAGIPPCQGCHGRDALGFRNALQPNRSGHVPYATYPILRGQQRDYLQIRLGQYQGDEFNDSTPDLVMSGVGHRLDPDSIAALSSYLSSLYGN